MHITGWFPLIPGLPVLFHRFCLHFLWHKLDRVAERRSRHLFSVFNDESKDFISMFPACFLEQPAITLLHHIVSVSQEQGGNFDRIVEELSPFCRYDQ